MANLKATELYQLTMRILPEEVEGFKQKYQDIFAVASKEAGLKEALQPIQIIIAANGNICAMVLRNPSIPGYKLQNYVHEVSNEVKRNYASVGSVIINKRQVRVDADNLPTKMSINEKLIEEIFKKGEEDDLFKNTEVNRGYVPKRAAERKRAAEAEEDRLARRFDALHGIKEAEKAVSETDDAEKVTSVKVTLEKEGIEEATLNRELAEEAAAEVVKAFSYETENNGQLVFVF